MPNAVWLPLCLSFEKMRKRQFDFAKCKPPLIVHSPSAPRDLMSGTKEFYEIIEFLRDKHEFEFDIIQGVSNDECLRRKAPATIFFDRFNIYGLNCVESAFFRSAVLAGVEDWVYAEVKRQTGMKCPFLQTLEVDDLEHHLDYLLSNPDYTKQLAHECLEYAVAVHNGQLTTQTFEKLVEEKT